MLELLKSGYPYWKHYLNLFCKASCLSCQIFLAHWVLLSSTAVFNSLIILQWNCRSVRDKKNELLILINEHVPDVFVLSETWLLPNSNLNIPNYTIARKDRDDGFGGVLVACKISLKAVRVDIISAYECAVCSIQFRNGNKLSIASLYFPATSVIPLTKNAMKTLIDQIPAPRMLLGDFNAHGQQWGCATNDRRAVLLMAVFDDCGLTTLNSGEITRVACPPRPCSSIDLSICSANIALNCTWQVLNQTHGSDHIPIIVGYNYGRSLPIVAQSGRIRTKNIKWDLFNDHMQRELNIKIKEIQEPVEQYSLYTEVLIGATQTASSSRLRVNNLIQNERVPKPWWCGEH